MSKKRKKAPGRRPTGKLPPNFKKQLEAKAAQTGLNRLPTMSIVATIDTMIGILRGRGYKIRDWDEKDKVVQKMKYIGGKVYILAPREPSETEAGDGERREHDTGQ